MTPKQVKDIFDKLPSKRRKVLVGFLAGHSREKIMIDADIPSDAALTGHLKELYKNFRIDTSWNDADDRRSGARKLPSLISLFARCMPELISDRIPDVLDDVEQEEAIAKPQREPIESDAGPIEARYFRATSNFDSLEPLERKSRIQVLEEIASNKDFPRYHWKVMEFLADFVRRKAPRREEEEGEERSPKLSVDIQAALTVIGRRDTNKDSKNQYLDLRQANLTGVDLSQAHLERINFTRANLSLANLSLAILKGANLEGANLEGANLDSADLNGANLFQAVLSKARFRAASLEKAILMQTDLSWARLDGANLRGVYLNKANLKGADLSGVNLSESHLQDANLEGVQLVTQKSVNCRVEPFNPHQIKLTEVNMEGTLLRGANLKGVNLCEANLRRADLSEANLKGANFSRAKNIGLGQLRLAYGDSITVLPNTVERPAHWM